MRICHALPFPLILLTGCALNISTEPVVAGKVVLCFYEEGQLIEGNLSQSLSGEITDFRVENREMEGGQNLCHGKIERRVEIQDQSGKRWQIAYGVEDEIGFSRTPTLEFEKGMEVDFILRQAEYWGIDAAFSISQWGWPVLAMEYGQSQSDLLAEELNGFGIRDGSTIGDVETECGPQLSKEIIFDGDKDVAVIPYTSAPLSLSGETYTVTAVANLQWSAETTCTDLVGIRAWVLAYNND